MAAMHPFKKRKGALHEPAFAECKLLLQLQQKFVMPVQGPNACAKRKEALHEPGESAQSFGGHRDFKFRGPLCPPKLCAETLARRTDSMVHGPNASAKRKGASHEPPCGGGHPACRRGSASCHPEKATPLPRSWKCRNRADWQRPIPPGC